MKLAVYPGSFDPVTYGHLDVITRGARLFDRLIVLVIPNGEKTPAFTAEERVELIRKTVKDIPNVEVMTYPGLLADFFDEVGADVVIKGMRSVSDFEDEQLMANINRTLNPRFETVLLMTDNRLSHVCSRAVRDIGRHGGDLSAFVPEAILEEVRNKLRPKK